MKPGLFLSGIILLSVTFACNKDHLIYNHCNNDLTGTDISGLPSSVKDSAMALLDSNNIDMSHLLIQRINSDGWGGIYLQCYQYVNGLRVFRDELGYHFDQNDSLTYISGYVVDSVSLSPVPQMDRQKVIQVYLKAVMLDDNPIFNRKEEVFKSCHSIELGYYWINANDYPAPPVYTRAWFVKPEGMDFPNAFINDQTSALIQYSDGIVFDHWGK